MKLKCWLRNGPMLAAVGVAALIPMTSMAAIGQPCAASEASECSWATNAPEARNLLNDMWRDADQVARQANSLQNLANDPNADRQIQADQLGEIQATIAEMDKRLCSLEGIQASLPSAEQQVMREASPLVRSMENDNSNALGDLNKSIPYGGYTQILTEEAQTVAQDINLGEHLADMQQRAASHQKNQGMLEVFGFATIGGQYSDAQFWHSLICESVPSIG